jgi:uncharacterized protein YbjT (DUF2867 family)
MAMRVAVAGGTGLAGRHVVAALDALGHRTVVMARSRGVNLVTGDGLDRALASVDAVVDASNTRAMGSKRAVGFFETAGRNLLAAEERAGVRHHVVLSIVGIDRVEWGYYQGKLRQEELARASGVPWTVLRATQFHEFTDQVLGLVPGPVAVVPRMRSQPVAVAEVAALVAEVALGPAQGMAPELAGPRVESVPDMARRLLRARGIRRRVLAVPLPGAAGRGMAGGALLPAPEGPRGTLTFDAWLAQAGGGAASAPHPR